MGIQRIIFYYLVAMSLVSACTTDRREQKKVKLTYLTEVNSLDPRYGYEIPANHTIKMLFEGLMRLSSTQELIPAAAQSFSCSEDGLVYTFKIRSAKWSNGSPVTAYDFEYAWKCILDPALPTQGTADFYPIKNAELIARGELPLESAGVKALDDRTLLVELEYPAPYFLELTATSAYSPVYSDQEEMSLVTNGPFRLKERREHDRMILEKNPLYWNAQAVLIEKIEISIVEDVATQLALFEKGESDWFGKPFAKLPLDAVPYLEKKHCLEHFPERAVFWYFLNTKKFPLNHQKVRRALALAANREKIVAHILQEGEEGARSVNRGHAFFADGAVEEARTLFSEALEELGLTLEAFPEIPLSYCNIETNHRISCALQQQWEEVLGIKVKLQPQEWTTYYDNLCQGHFSVGGLSWHARIRDPIYNLQLFKYADDRLNMSNWEDEAFQRLLTQAEREKDVEIRRLLLEQAEEQLMDQMPVIPIYFMTMSYAKSPELKNVTLTDLNEIDFAWASR